MPLLDHFHPPLLRRRHWAGFYGQWAAVIADTLNAQLPSEYVAAFHLWRSTRAQADIGADSEHGVSGALPAPVGVVPAFFPDDFEVQVFTTATGFTVVAVIELVSAGNKDRAE